MDPFLMQNNQQFKCGKGILPSIDDETGNDVSIFDPFFPAFAKPKQFHGIEFQPSTVCPKNFVIFDQTDERSQVMFHPALARSFNYPALNIVSDDYRSPEGYDFGTEPSCSHQEDPDDIDALLSLEEEESEQDEEEEGEEVSSSLAYGNNWPSSCSGYGLGRDGCSSRSANNGEKKRGKMKKMMTALKGIVPGGEQMNTASVLDEAVKYLKSLKLEAKRVRGGKGFEDDQP